MLKRGSLFLLLTVFSSVIFAKENKIRSEETLADSLSKLTPKKSAEMDQGDGDSKRTIKFHRLSRKDANKPLRKHRRKEQRRLEREAETARQEVETKYLDAESDLMAPKRHSLIFMSASELENGQHYIEWIDGTTGQSATALSNLDFSSLNQHLPRRPKSLRIPSCSSIPLIGRIVR